VSIADPNTLLQVIAKLSLETLAADDQNLA